MNLEQAVGTCRCGEDFTGVNPDDVDVGDDIVTYKQYCHACEHLTTVTKKRKSPKPTVSRLTRRKVNRNPFNSA